MATPSLALCPAVPAGTGVGLTAKTPGGSTTGRVIGPSQKETTIVTVTATFGTTAQVRQAVDDLIAAGIPADAISAVTSAGKPVENLSPTETDVLGHIARDAGIGALVGGAAGLALSPLVLPGLGLLLVAGPLTFSGALAGSVVGALIGTGHDADDAVELEQQLLAGRYLVVAHTDLPQAQTVLEQAGAADIRVAPDAWPGSSDGPRRAPVPRERVG